MDFYMLDEKLYFILLGSSIMNELKILTKKTGKTQPEHPQHYIHTQNE
jgi:hypothetical protein